jgi:hypothetical protein
VLRLSNLVVGMKLNGTNALRGLSLGLDTTQSHRAEWPSRDICKRPYNGSVYVLCSEPKCPSTLTVSTSTKVWRGCKVHSS